MVVVVVDFARLLPGPSETEPLQSSSAVTMSQQPARSNYLFSLFKGDD